MKKTNWFYLAVLVLLAASCVQPISEDCIDFDYTNAEVKQISGSWKIVVGNMWMLDFAGNKTEADRSLEIINHYQMNKQCFVGRPDPDMEYFLVNGSSPVGALAGEDCVSFNPDTIEVVEIDGSWKVVDGPSWLLDFGTSQSEANKARKIIQKYGFSNVCFVGRPDASMIYFRK
ncbi:MAG: hypothetical protein OEZ02_10905 [Anaerolineae bacterium]|nr:hypothetical protein [Anaerolineae bacterium]